MSFENILYGKEVELKKMLISTEDYQRMGEAGIFEDKPKVELIDGIIYAKSPMTPYHNSHVDKISTFFTLALADRAIIRTQGSIRTDSYSEPEPDIAILHFKENYYNDRQASAEDTYLVIEVAVKTLRKDKTLKLKKYASVGISEYWIVAPEKGLIEVYKKPEGETYLEQTTYTKTDEWLFSPFQLPVKGSDLLI